MFSYILVKQVSLIDIILLSSQGVSFLEVQEGMFLGSNKSLLVQGLSESYMWEHLLTLKKSHRHSFLLDHCTIIFGYLINVLQ